MLCKSAVLSEVDDERSSARTAMRDAVAKFDAVTERATGRVGDPRGTDTAIVLLSRIFAGHTPKTDDGVTKGADALLADLPKWDADADLERVYFGTLGLYQFGGRRWRPWSEAQVSALLGHQRTSPDDPERGSWDAIGVGAVAAGGRVWSTALACMRLEVYYRLGDLEMFRRDEDKWNR
jgi:hypothetical protein